MRDLNVIGFGALVRGSLLGLAGVAMICISGCKSSAEHRIDADTAAYDIIKDGQVEALGKIEDFTILQPSDIFRRRLIESQDLLYSAGASLGRDKIDAIEHLSDDSYFDPIPDPEALMIVLLDGNIMLSQIDALMVAAQNNSDYQKKKEDIFRAALDLDLERNEFRSIFSQAIKNSITSNTTGNRAVSGRVTSSETSVSKKLTNGATVAGQLAVDFANLLTLGGASSIGLKADASVSIPLMRGAGRHIVTEDLTQAQRNVIYAIYDFERFKKTFMVSVSDEYLNVLQQQDQVNNALKNYEGLVISVRTARRKADAGLITEMQVDQAVQDELRARDGWISAIQRSKQTLDEFKILIGIPTDARIELDRDELEELAKKAQVWLAEEGNLQSNSDSEKLLAAKDPVVIPDPGGQGAGPLEIDDDLAVIVAFENRLDLRKTQDAVEDKQRAVMIAADRLRGELTLLGSVASGQRRNDSTSGAAKNSRVELDRVSLTALLTIDLPIERTAERNAYRKSYIDLEETMRSLQSLEDQIKLQVRNRLRALLSARESMLIQAKARDVAVKRVESTNMFLNAGRAQIRDLLEAKEALLNAQNSLTAAIKNYRISELQLQRDMGVLEVNQKGLIKEIDPEVLKNAG
jgi:outer membrane protein TolC